MSAVPTPYPGPDSSDPESRGPEDESGSLPVRVRVVHRWKVNRNKRRREAFFEVRVP